MDESLPEENNSKEPPISSLYPRIIGQSKILLDVFDIIEKVRNTNTTVLIQGESGTGKELIAQALHYGSERKNGPFIPVN